MAESKPKSKFGTPQEHIPTCDKHGELIDMVCEDCDEFICTDCAKTDHKDHNWVTIVKAASQRKRQLLGFIKTIKDEKVPKIDRKIENASIKLKEIERQSDNEIRKLGKHFDEIVWRLTEIKARDEKTLRDQFNERSEQVNRLKTQFGELKKDLVETTKFMEENNSTMSDYNLIDNHRELLKLVSAGEEDTKICEYSLRYTRKVPDNEELDSLMGKMLDLEDICITETNSFQYSDNAVYIINAFSENDSYIHCMESDYMEHINKQGEKKQKYNVAPKDICVTDNGDVYFTDIEKKAIIRLTPPRSLSKVVSIRPFLPTGICQSLDGGLLLTMGENSLVRHMTLTGDVIHEYKYQEDGQTRLFASPLRVKQNGNSDICVVNKTGDTNGNVVILSISGRLRSVYKGQNLKEFFPLDVACDSRCNIFVSDFFNHQIHLLSPDGEFLKFLLNEFEVIGPSALSLYGSTLWVGNFQGVVKLFQL
jgi:hypothetical protein